MHRPDHPHMEYEMKELCDRGSSGEHGWSTLSRYLRCLRQGVLAEQRADRDDTSSPQARGILLHTGLAHLYLRRMPGGRDRWLSPSAAVEEYVARHKQDSPHYEYWRAAVLDALRAYVDHYGAEPELEVLGVEKVVAAEVLDPSTSRRYPYTLRYDLKVRDKRTGKIIVYDHKGTFAILHSVTQTYDLDGQMLGITRMMREIHPKDFAGVAMNFVRIPKPGTKGVPDFKRTTPTNTPRAVLDFPNTIRLAHKLRNAARGYADPLDAPGAYNDACWNKYGPCQFREQCSFGRK